MDLRELILTLISLLSGLVCVYGIRRLDRYEREPFGKLVLATLVGGGCAAGLALGCFEALTRLGIDAFECPLGAWILIGPVEEMAKLCGLFAIFGCIRGELSEPADGIIYQACVALGFSLVENYLYAAVPAQEYLILIRLLAATPLHIAFSALMGLCVFLWYGNRRAWHLMVSAYLFASLSHSLYDLFVFQNVSVLFLGAALLCMYVFTRNLFVYALAVSPRRISLAQTVAVTPAAAAAKGLVCLHCGDTGVKPTLTIAGAGLHYCERCDHFNTSRNGLFRLFYHFAGMLKSTARPLLEPSSWGDAFETLYRGNHICLLEKRAVFRLTELDAALESLNYRLKKQLRSHWYLPANLVRLDRPGEEIDYVKMVRDAKASFWRRLVFPLAAGRQRAHHPPNGGPCWNWGAFLLPEIWYPVHQIGGVLPAMLSATALITHLMTLTGLALLPAFGWTALMMRLISGRWGAHIYYRRHGRWP